MSDSNKSKSRHGSSGKQALGDLLLELKNNNLLISYETNYRTGYQDYSDDQFYAPYLLTLNNGEKWALYNTTSMRTDRIKGNQWDAFNLKTIEPAITKAFLIYPDSVSNEAKDDFSRQRLKYYNKQEYSVIDDIINQSELLHLIEDTVFEDMNSGSRLDLRGHNFEKQISYVLSNQANFEKWKGVHGSDLIVGVHYDLYEYILDAFDLNKNSVKAMTATTDVGRLPSGGLPKTDVLVSVLNTDDTLEHFTISCKRTSASSVTVHEYTADAFADVLDKENSELRNLLKEFQKNPSLTSFGEQNGQKLKSALKPYLEKLYFWVLGGINGIGDPETQWANYILTSDNNTGAFAIFSLADYYKKLKASGVKGHFGTIFSWTYPSKKRGKSIQLKCKVL